MTNISFVFDLFNVKTRTDADLTGDTDIIVRTLKQPTCSKVNIEGKGVITFDIEKELGVEVVGETKVKIAIEEDEEPWDEIDDEMDEKIEEEIDPSFYEKLPGGLRINITGGEATLRKDIDKIFEIFNFVVANNFCIV